MYKVIYLETKGNVWKIREDEFQHYNMVITNFDFQEFLCDFEAITLIVAYNIVKTSTYIAVTARVTTRGEEREESRVATGAEEKKRYGSWDVQTESQWS